MTEEKKYKKLYRSRTDRIIAGVCGGLAEYSNADPVFIRIAFLILMFFNGLGVLVYLVLILIIPLEPGLEVKVNREKKIGEMVRGVKNKAKSLMNEFKKDKENKEE